MLEPQQPAQLSPRSTWEHSVETRMLRHYFSSKGGRMYTEVPIGKCLATPDSWASGCGIRRIDGVRIAAIESLPMENGTGMPKYGSANQAQFKEDIEAYEPEVIEVKRVLNRSVIGQAIVAKHLFLEQFGVQPRLVILCGKTDAALEWVCGLYNIKVVVIDKAMLPPIPSVVP